ncbi:pentatricopeptide repeat-containing protein [Trifolium medium]|uniref:Pentatricopeptide repeat-containing protein n=1 Tax=Trifolium medium TaxID=97028 RepID=A0A392SAE7_9FABA|nr:pentatricopeptide repeat-containing protein [Trifolium medium]
MRNEVEEDTGICQSKSETVDCSLWHPILKTYSEQDVRDVLFMATPC